jgi:Zn-dependent peptidase ImmA (M78 family)
MTRKKVAFLESKIIESEATKLLKLAHQKGFYDFNRPTPIDLIVEIILKLNINFSDLNKDFEGVLGALDIKSQMIWLDESLNHTQTDNFTDEARCNFTIAHECGHYILMSLPFFGQFSGKEKSKLCTTKTGKIIL